MRLAVISDCHIGNHRRFGGPVVAGLNRRCSQAVAALKLAAETAAEQKCDALIITGDLFDGVKPEPQVIAAVQRALAMGPPVTYIIKGNHDSVSDLHGDHALGPLDMDRENGWVVIFDQPNWYPLGHANGSGVDLFFIPFHAGPASEWLPAAMDKVLSMRPAAPHTKCPTALFLHLGIEDEKTAAFLRGSADSIPASTLAALMQSHGIRACFAGNYHDPREWHYAAGSLLGQGQQERSGAGVPARSGSVLDLDCEHEKRLRAHTLGREGSVLAHSELGSSERPGSGWAGSRPSVSSSAVCESKPLGAGDTTGEHTSRGRVRSGEREENALSEGPSIHGREYLLSGQRLADVPDLRAGKNASSRAVSIFQVGALCPTGFDNPGPDYGRLVIWDTENETAEQLCIPGPRFIKITDGAMDGSDAESARSLVRDGCQVYVSIATDLDGFPAAEALYNDLLANGVVDGEIALDQADAEIAARDAAQAARGADTLQESLAGFVREMQLPDGVDRAEVLEKAQAYLKGA